MSQQLGEPEAGPAPAREERRFAEPLGENQAALQRFFDRAPFMMGIAELVGDRPVDVSGNRALARSWVPSFLPEQAAPMPGPPPPSRRTAGM